MKTRRLLAVTAAALCGLSMMTVTAHAGEGDCYSGHACLWRDTSYQTASTGAGWVAFEYGIRNLNGWYYNGKPATSAFHAANSASSIYSNGNDHSMVACFYDGPNYTGSMRCLSPKTGKSSLSWSWFNDCIESGRFIDA